MADPATRIGQGGAIDGAADADAALRKVYDRESASSDQSKIDALMGELRCAGGIARTCEAATPEQRARYDRLALETIHRALAGRPRR